MHLPTSPLQRLLAITASVLACATPAQALVAPPLIDVISYSGTDGVSNAWGYNDGRYSGQRVGGWLSGEIAPAPAALEVQPAPEADPAPDKTKAPDQGT